MNTKTSFKQMIVLLHVAVATCAAASGSAALAQDWPTKPLTFVVAAGTGSSVDVFARVLADRLGAALKQPIIVNPRPGGNGVIASQAVATAKPDGYTLLFAGNSVLVITPLMSKNLPYNAEKDFAAVAPVVYVPLAIAVRPDNPAKSLKELLAASKDKDVLFATPGSASLSRLIGENLNQKTGTRFVNIAYPNAGAAQTDVIGGQVPVLIDGLGGIAPHVKAGRLRLLAVSTATRAKEFPDAPSISEAIPGFAVPGINSIVAPAGTPIAILDLLNKNINAITSDRAVAERYASMGGEAAPGSRTDLERLLKEQRVLFRQLIEHANIKE